MSKTSTNGFLDRWIQRLLPGSWFGRNVTVLAGVASLGQAITVASSPLLTRLYTPADFGVLAVFASLLGVLTVAAALRYELAIPLPEEDSVAANLLALALLIVVGTSLLVGFLIFVAGEQISSLLQVQELGAVLWLLPVGVLFAGSYLVFTHWAIRTQSFLRIGRTKLYQSLGKVGTQVGAGFFAPGPFGLVLGQVVGRGAGTGTLARLALQSGETLRGVSWRGIKKAADRFVRFPKFASGSSVMNAAGMQLPAVLLAAFYGADVAGWFALSQRVIAVPADVVGEAVAQVYLGKAPELARETSDELLGLFRDSVRRLLLLGMAPLAALAAGGPWMFEVVFGPSWSQVGWYVRILAGMFLVRFGVMPLSQTLNILERQHVQFVWDTGRLLLVLGALVATKLLGGADTTAVGAYAAAMILSYFILYWLSERAIRAVTDRSDSQSRPDIQTEEPREGKA